ncbi:hypothetical protein HOG48_02995 [Candidatus Peregrinibacteria bacterium]|nr:hypothetical protein [Candidatus Peregrinibacteria bacterium]
MDEIHSEYVGETYNETFMYKTYLHSYDGFDLYTSNANYNLKGRSFDEYYISQITSKSPDFYSSRGITAGSTVDKVMDAYGNTNILEKEGDSFVSYDYEDMKMSYFLDANDVVEEIVFRTM